MLEVNIRIAPAAEERPDPFGDFVAARFGIVPFAQTKVDKIRRKYLRHLKLVGLRQAQRNVPSGEPFVHFIHQPGYVAKFKSKADVGGKQGQVSVEPRQVTVKGRRKLKKNRAQPPRRAQRFERLQKNLP